VRNSLTGARLQDHVQVGAAQGEMSGSDREGKRKTELAEPAQAKRYRF